jgi:hypothetical protein
MPSLHFWFTGTALYLCAATAVPLALAVIGVRGMLHPIAFRTLMFVVAILTFLGWRSAAVQEQLSETQESRWIQSQRKWDDIERKSDSAKKMLEDIAGFMQKLPDQSAKVMAGRILDQFGPRGIPDNVAKAIMDELKTAPAATFFTVVYNGDEETHRYLNRIGSILVAAGWSSLGVGEEAIIGGTPMVGLSFCVNPGQQLSASAANLQAILDRHGVPINPGVAMCSRRGPIITDGVGLLLGRKPL